MIITSSVSNIDSPFSSSTLISSYPANSSPSTYPKDTFGTGTSSDSGAGAIAGAIIGAFAFVLSVAIAFQVLKRRRRKHEARSSVSGSPSNPDVPMKLYYTSSLERSAVEQQFPSPYPKAAMVNISDATLVGSPGDNMRGTTRDRDASSSAQEQGDSPRRPAAWRRFLSKL